MQKNKNNIVLIGGNLFNKGAQAMTFTVIDQIRRINPNVNVYLFSDRDFKRDYAEKSVYKFEIMSFSVKEKINVLSPLIIFRNKGKVKLYSQDIEKILLETQCIFDISGYALSSEFYTENYKNFTRSLFYLFSIMIAKKFSVQYYILPQSMGPFKYPLIYRIILNPLLKKFLKYPTKIFVREKKGYQEVQKYTKNNVALVRDIVLSGEEYNMDNIFNIEPKIRIFKILQGSVGIVPNKKISDRIGEESFLLIYKSIIRELLVSKKAVYILRHSAEDLSICLKLKKLFEKEKRVKIISDDLNCIELENVISRFDFLVASRYHSVVHAYKRNVPVLCIGWAVKYRELLVFFKQERYFFDVNENFGTKGILQVMYMLLNKSKIESKVIMQKRRSMKNDFGEDFFREIFS